MKLQKEVGIWVKAVDELPTEKGWYILKCTVFNFNKVCLYNPECDTNKRFEEATGWENNQISWLEPIRDVFVLTESELEEIMWNYGNHCAASGQNSIEIVKPKDWIKMLNKNQ